MVKTTGETVYKYTVRNGKFFFHEGAAIERGSRKCVYFKAKSSTERYPKEAEFGVVHANGPSLWLTERNDELAKRILIEFEEQGLADLQKQIERKAELIKLLKEEL